MTGDYLTHGLTLTLAWFVATNAAFSLLTAGAVSMAGRDTRSRSPRIWMFMRLAPATLATLFAALLFVPSYWKFEPRQNVEGFDLSLTAIALVGLIVLVSAIMRGLDAWFVARRRVRQWMSHARPMRMPETRLPAYVVDAEQPMLALAGVLRPKLLVTRGLIDALTPAELEAAVAHEVGHQRSLDNLKRLVMCAAPDFLTYFGAARRIERRWAAAAEHAADRISGLNTAAARCALASALVKVARLTPATVGHAEPISTLIAGGEIASRVQRLLSDDERAPRPRWDWARLGALVASIVVVWMAYVPLLRSVHEVTESLVHWLP